MVFDFPDDDEADWPDAIFVTIEEDNYNKLLKKLGVKELKFEHTEKDYNRLITLLKEYSIPCNSRYVEVEY